MFRQRKDIARYSFNVASGIERNNFVQPSPIRDFMTEKVTYFSGSDKKTAIAYVDDIYMLFNQNRLNSVGRDTIQKWLDGLTPRSDSLAQLRKKVSDEQLMDMCKSRYIQSSSELLAWSEYLNANYASILSEIEASKAPEPTPEPTSQPAPTE